MKKILLLLAFVGVLAGCTNTNTEPVQKSNLTVGMIKKELIKGHTTQNDVLQLFGAPNLVTTNSSGQEVWNYNKSSYVTGSTTQTKDWWLILFGGSSSSSNSNATTQSMDLLLTFNKAGILLDYKVISAAY